MNAPVKQHLIDPEICIRCHACEEACPINAISHNDDNVVVDAAICEFCMNCVSPCPTGAIDNWHVVSNLHSLDEQFSWTDLPPIEKFNDQVGDGAPLQALDKEVAALLAKAHEGAGGITVAPKSASKPSINLHNSANPVRAVVRGNFRLTDKNSDHDVRHIILDFGARKFPVLEGQSIGIIRPGTDGNGKTFQPRLYSVSSPRDGERPSTNNLSLTVKRHEKGECSNFVCDLKLGDEVQVTGPFGTTFLLPDDTSAKLIMICTGTGSAPFRAFTMRRQRIAPSIKHSLSLYFGARDPASLPYFGPLEKVPDQFLEKHFAFSRIEGTKKEYVQDKMRGQSEKIAAALRDNNTYIYICGLKAMEIGVESALEDIARAAGLKWDEIRKTMRAQGRYHVETY